MDYYNDALSHIKSADVEKAKYCAQAGLISMHLASELIGAENQMALPGWRGLSNPMLVSSLRRATQLVGELTETRQRLHKKEKADPETLDPEQIDKTKLLRKHWEKAYNDLTLAIHSLASGSVAHAQALVKGALREMEVVRDIIGIEDPEILQEEFEAETRDRTPVADALGALIEVREILEDAKLQRKDFVLSCLDKIGRAYKDGQKFYEKGQYEKAEKAISDALLDLDLVRQQIQFRKQKNTSAQSAE
jgi:hypothetical protein